MANTYNRYTAAAGQTEFDLTFPYRRRTEVEVVVGIEPREFTWVTDTRIALVDAAEAGDAVEVRRSTGIQTPAVTFQGGSIITDTNLNSAVQQVLYRMQEIEDRGGLTPEATDIVVDLVLDASGAQLNSVLNNAGLALDESQPGKFKIEVTPEAYRGIGFSDAQAIQSAIDAVSQKPGGGNVRLDGLYTCATPVTLKSNVRLHGGSLKASPTMTSGYLVGIGQGSKNPMIVGVNLDCTEMQPSTPYGATAIQDMGGATGVLIHGNTFVLADTDETSPFVPWHASFMTTSSGVFTSNYCGVCGGDTYNFNGGRWTITGNYATDSADGGIALNNAIHAVVTGNYLYRCNLGIGAGPHGTNAQPFRALSIQNNVVEACAVGINVGWYGYEGRVPAQYCVITGNQVTRCRDIGICYISSNPADELAPHIADNQVAECGSTAYTGAAGPGTGIAVVGCKYPTVQSNKVIKSGGTEGIAYVLSGVDQAVFSDNSSFENNVDVKYEECSVHIGRLYCDRVSPNNIEVGTITVLSEYKRFADATIRFLTLGYTGQTYFTEEGNYPRIVWDGPDSAVQAYNRGSNTFDFETEGQNILRVGTGGISVLGSPMSFERDYTGTTSASGGVWRAHSIPSATSRFRGGVAMVQEGGGNWVTLPSFSIDGTNIGFSGAAANRPYRIVATWSAATL